MITVQNITEDSRKLQVYRITASCGAYIEVCNYGARWLSAVMPDGNGSFSETLLGYDSPDSWLNDPNCTGATVGRFANRIANASFVLNGNKYTLDKNDGQNNLHSGPTGMSFQYFESRIIDRGVEFSYLSPDGEGGFPGDVKAIVTYTLQDDCRVRVEHRLTSSCLTPAGLTNHAYFNLDNNGNSVLSHRIQINSQHVLETNSQFIPSGRILSVEGTEFDFTSPRKIGERFNLNTEQLVWNRGYNHCYTLPTDRDCQAVPATILYSSDLMRKLELYTNYPAVLMYSGGFLTSSIPCRYGRPLQPSDGIALECQFYPDSPNHDNFPSCLLQLGQERVNWIEYRFEGRNFIFG